MSYDLTASEIQKGLWMIAPLMAEKYLTAALDHLKQPKAETSEKEVQGAFIREVVDPNGNYVNLRQDEIPQDSVGIIRCIGPMYKYGGYWYWGTDELVAFAEQFDKEPNIIGQVWHDDSGGGTISSVGPYLEFLAKKTKPVVSLVDTCGSANYFKNCGTDHIMAENDISAMIGSIGVMIHFYNYQKMLKDMGIVEHIINSSLSADKNKAFELAYKGKYDLIRSEYLDPAALRFQNHVKEMRPNLNLDVPGILSGKMFYAEEALENRMIDSIGGLDAAIDRVKFLASARSFINM